MNLLVHYSKFFRAALTGNFSEARNKTVKLEEDDPEVFELFVHWLYYQRFPDKSLGDDETILKIWIEPNRETAYTHFYIYLYLFGDKYDVPSLRSDTINELVRFMETEPDSCLTDPPAIRAAFTRLPQNSPMCRLLVDIYCYYGDPKIFNDPSAYDCVLFLQGIWHKYAEMHIEAEGKHDDIGRHLKLSDYQE
jgi:hypothetical protein